MTKKAAQVNEVPLMRKRFGYSASFPQDTANVEKGHKDPINPMHELVEGS